MVQEKISFLSEGQRIDGTLIMPENSGLVPAVIFFPGMTSNQDGYVPIAQRLTQLGIAGLALSLRGRGTSEGDFNTLNIHDMMADGLTSYDFLIGREGIDIERIGICGASVGANVAALVSKDKKVKSLILRAPAIYSEQMMGMTFAETMAVEGKLFNNLDDVVDTPPVRAISQFQGSLLVIASGNDLIIPARMPEAYFSQALKASKKELVTLEGATHALREEGLREQFIAKTIEWFKETL